MRLRGVLAAVTVATSVASAPLAAQQRVSVGHLASPTVSVRLFTAAVGSVHVVGWEKDSVELTGVVPNGSRVEMSGGAPMEALKGIKMFVETPTDLRGREGQLVLKVPRGARVWVKTGTTDMDVTGVAGGLDLNVVGGLITVHGSPRELRAESMDANVIVEGSPEWARIKTATGDITMRGGVDIGASTISGTIRSSGGDVERAKLESTTGGIVFASDLARSASVELESHSGTIEVELLRRGDVELDVATITGAIENQWSKTRPVPGREGRGMTLTTSWGMNSGHITVRSFKGQVQVRPR